MRMKKSICLFKLIENNFNFIKFDVSGIKMSGKTEKLAGHQAGKSNKFNC